MIDLTDSNKLNIDSAMTVLLCHLKYIYFKKKKYITDFCYCCFWFIVDCCVYYGILLLFYVLLWVTLCPIKFCNHLDGEEKTDYFTQFVFMVSRDWCVALLRGAMGLSAVSNFSSSWSTHLFVFKSCIIQKVGVNLELGDWLHDII